MKKAPVFIIILFIVCLPLYRVEAQDTMDWKDCFSEAKKNNPELISAVESINTEKAAKSITASGLFPQIDTSLGASTAGASTTSSAGVTAKSTTDTYTYGVSGTQLIFDGLKTYNNIKADTQNLKAAEQAYRFTSSQVRLSLRTAFINLLKAQELIRVAEEIVKIRRDNLELITLQYQSGLEHRGALLTAEANLAGANFELSQAKRNVEFVQRQLTKEMGRKEFKPFSVKGDFSVRDSAKEKLNFEDLVKTNPSLLQSAFKKNAALLGIKSTYANFAPEFSGTAGASKRSSHWPPEDNQWNLGLSLSMPIFEGGLRIAQVSQAEASYRKAEADYRNIRDSAIVSLEQAWAALQDAIETVTVQGKTLEASRERSKIAEAQYSIGFIAFDNWIIIENDLVSAKKTYLQAQANALLTEANWIQAKGETLEYAQ